MFYMVSAVRRWVAGLYYGPVPILAALVLAFAVVQHFWPALSSAQKYTDLVVGHVTWMDKDKGRDFRALALFLGCLGGATVGIGALCRWVGRDGPNSEVGQGLSCLLLLALLPAVWWFGRAASVAELHSIYRPVVALILVGLAAIVGLRRYRDELSAARVLEVGGAFLLLALLGWFGGMGLATLLGRVFAKRVERLEVLGFWFAILTPLATCGFAVLAVLLSPRLEVVRQRLFRGLFLVQIPLPFLFCILIPAPLLVGNRLERLPMRATLPLALAGLTILCWVLLARRYRAWRAAGAADGTGLAAVLSSLALSAIPVFVLLPGGYLPTLLPDHFHYGEQLLPWQQLTVWHRLPYADFVPIHGLMPLLRLGSGALFFDGTSASYFAADHVLLALWLVTTFLTARPLIGPVAALFLALCVALPMPFDRFYFLAPGLLLLAHPSLRIRPGRWLAVWSVLVPFEILYNAALGPAFLLATAPVALWMVWRLLRDDRAALLRLTAAWGLVALAVACWPTGRAMLHGFVSFLSENAATNDTGNGIPLSTSIELQAHGGAAGTYFLWEAVRFSWVFIMALAGGLFFKELARPREQRNAQTLWLSALVAPTLLLVSPWTLGRIDPNMLSRVGCLSYVGIAFLMPPLVLAGRPLIQRPFVAVFLVLALAVSDLGATNQIFPGHLSAKPFAYTVVPPGVELTDGSTLGMPTLGRLVLPPNDRAELTELKQTMDGWLRPGETFLDLTNRHAFYYYLNLPVPTLYSANYVACNSQMQQRMLRQLDANPTPVVMLPHDWSSPGEPAALRSYHLYRTYALRYVPVHRGRFTFLVDPARVPEAVGQDRAAQVRLLTEAFRTPDLLNIPAAWGRSWSTLADRFDVVARLRPTPLAMETTTSAPSLAGNSPAVSCQLTDLELTGQSADYLKIDLSCDPIKGQALPIMQIAWDSANPGLADSAVLNATNTCLLVPLGSYPSWLLSDRLATLQFRLTNPASCQHFAIHEVQLLRLKTGE